MKIVPQMDGVNGYTAVGTYLMSLIRRVIKMIQMVKKNNYF